VAGEMHWPKKKKKAKGVKKNHTKKKFVEGPRKTNTSTKVPTGRGEKSEKAQRKIGKNGGGCNAPG